MNPIGKFFVCRQPDLHISKRQQKRLEKTGSCEVTYPVSYKYNGGIILTPEGKFDMLCKNPKSQWYDGFKIPKPIVPEGFELRCIGVGLIMSYPPYATSLLVKKT